MRLRLPVILALGVVSTVPAACATDGAADGLRVTYACDRGPDLVVVYVRKTARIESGDGPPLVLPQQRSGSGFAYGTATHTLRGKGDDVTYTIGRMTPLQCRVK